MEMIPDPFRSLGRYSQRRKAVFNLVMQTNSWGSVEAAEILVVPENSISVQNLFGDSRRYLQCLFRGMNPSLMPYAIVSSSWYVPNRISRYRGFWGIHEAQCLGSTDRSELVDEWKDGAVWQTGIVRLSWDAFSTAENVSAIFVSARADVLSSYAVRQMRDAVYDLDDRHSVVHLSPRKCAKYAADHSDFYISRTDPPVLPRLSVTTNLIIATRLMKYENEIRNADFT